ncbi:MAG TPA: hypothetical protein VHG91_09585 [Longimicrobium sp.]|nr:hypothetical protein [Longimicrobium sp.]
MRAPLRLTALALLATAACAPAVPRAAGPATYADGEALIRAMHDRYAGRWYRTLTFTQTTTRTPPGGQRTVEIWREYGAMPGRLRIEVGPEADGRGVIYAGDSTFLVRGGQVVGRRAARNPLMILGFDVYAQAPETTARILREEGFALSPVRLDSWQGRPAYVVGAAAGDLRSKQFWVDAERLVFVRMIEPSPGDTTKTEEIRFNDYRPAGGGWIAPEVEVLVDGVLVFHEAYADVRVDVPLDPSLWVPEQWTTARKPTP